MVNLSMHRLHLTPGISRILFSISSPMKGDVARFLPEPFSGTRYTGSITFFLS